MYRSRLALMAGLVALGVEATRNPDITVVMDEAHKLRKLRIDPPPRYRDTRIKGSYDDNAAPRPVKDPEAMSAADAKRARKAAKRLKEQQR
jgi:hypothetical protein